MIFPQMKHEQLIEPQRVDGRRVSESRFCLSLRPSILCGLALGAFAARVTAAPVDFGRDVRPFLDQHCVSCHGPKKEKGGVRLHTMGTISETPQFANTWLEVREQLLSGDMPPEDEKQPSEATRKAVIAWIDAEVERAQRESASTGGKVVLRRLNRNEYRETMREILHLHPAIDTALGLPDDDTFHGFDNIGSALNISSAQMRAYVENAARVLKMAFPAGKQPATEKTRIIAMDSAEFARISDDVARLKRELGNSVIPKAELNARMAEAQKKVPKIDPSKSLTFGAVTKKEYLPDGVVIDNSAQLRWAGRPAGLYRIRFHVKGVPNEKGDLPMITAELSASPPQENRPVITADLSPEFQTIEAEVFAEPYFNNLRIAVAAMGNRFFYKRGVQPPRMQVQWVEVEGPIVEDWPSRAWHEYFAKAADSEAGARAVLARFAELTFRRAPEAARLDQFFTFYQSRRAAGDDFETGVKLAMQGILAAPEFVFMVESKEGAEGKRQPLDDFELATRLSYFLWSGPPDEELRALAKAGQLRPALDTQVRRMIQHPRAARFAENFTGQWLKLRTLGQMEPDPKKFIEWEDTLKDSMRRETEQFFLHVLQKDLAVSQFIDSDFAMLNGRLAYFYGIPGVSGYDLRPVSLTANSQRGGLLGQASILTLTSDGIRTSPVKRGTFILENLLGDPPPPPPNDVPPVKESTGTTLKERLKSHREMAACAECHAKIDPPGFALENFNAIGKWREKEEETKLPVDPSGELKGAGSFAGFAEFKKLLAARESDVTRCLAENLLLYALGRPLDFTDDAVVKDLVKQTKAADGNFSALVIAITRSEPFLMK